MNSRGYIEIIKEALAKNAPNAHSILYGSRAREDYRADSDFDILVLLPEYLEDKSFVKEKFRISDVLYDLSLDLGIEISPLIVSRKEYYSRKTPFTINVANQGITLHQP